MTKFLSLEELDKLRIYHLNVVKKSGVHQWRLHEFCLGESLQNFNKK